MKTEAEIVSVSMFSEVSVDKLSCSQIWNTEKDKHKEREKVGY